jgi:hypothetical protein
MRGREFDFSLEDKYCENLFATRDARQRPRDEEDRRLLNLHRGRSVSELADAPPYGRRHSVAARKTRQSAVLIERPWPNTGARRTALSRVPHESVSESG